MCANNWSNNLYNLDPNLDIYRENHEISYKKLEKL